MTFPTLLAKDHRDCDELLSTAMGHAQAARWVEAERSFWQFCERVEAHFGAEESILFVRFEQMTGMTHGPTAVMRSEHEAVREAMDRINEAILARDANTVFGEGDALFILLQQHNLKEESILYPAAERAAGNDAVSLEADIRGALATPSKPAHRAT